MMKGSHWFQISGSVALLAIIGVGISFWRGSPHSAKPAVQPAAIGSPRFASFSGTIRAQHVVPVGAGMTGEIESFEAEAGQDVFEGQLLARIGNAGLETAREAAMKALDTARAKVSALESAIIAARLEASRARTDANRAKEEFEKLEKTYKRQEFLVGQGATPRLVYEKSRREFESSRDEFGSLDEIARQAEDRVNGLTTELQSAKKSLDDKSAQVEEAKADLAATEVHAPVSGIVVARRSEVGKQIGPEEGKELFQIAVDPALLQAVFQPDARTLSKVQPGLPAIVSIPDLNVTGLTAAVTKINANEVSADFISPNSNIRPGMNCSVSVQLQ